MSRLADDLPEVTELALNPVIARPDGAFVVDARIKVTPYQAQDPFLRQAALTRRRLPGDGYHGPFGKRIFKGGTLVPEPGDSLH